MPPARLTDAAIATALEGLNAGASAAWSRDGDRLQKAFRFPDFNTAFGFMTRVALIAAAMDHHPDWCNSYREVRVALTTHAAGGLTALDFTLAAHIDACAGQPGHAGLS